MKKIILCLCLTLAVTACKKDMLDTTQWVGKWAGPEGTYLEIKHVGNGYSLAIANLDGEKIFNGVAVRNGIEFERDGKTELIKSGTGDESGMKWLAGKKDCLVITFGEGYCRD